LVINNEADAAIGVLNYEDGNYTKKKAGAKTALERVIEEDDRGGIASGKTS